METNDSTLRVNTFDVLDELRSAPEAWDSIARANAKLNRSGKKSKKIANETEALTETAEIIGDDDLQGGKATIIGLGRTASHATFGMVAVEGRYESLAVLKNDHGRRQAAVCVRTGRGKSVEKYYFPLDSEALAYFEVEVTEQDRPRYLIELEKNCQIIKRYLKSAEFQGLEESAKYDQMELIVEDLNLYLGAYIYGDRFEVECSRHSSHVETSGVYSVESESKKSTRIYGNNLQVVLLDSSDGPIIELSDSSSGTRYRLQPADIDDVIQYEDDNAVVVNLFDRWFDDSYQDAARSLETDLKYADYEDLNEWNNTYLDAVEDLEHRLPSDNLLDLVRITGFAYVQVGRGDYELKFFDTNEVIVDEVEFIRVGSEFRATLSATLPGDDGRSDQTINIVPSPEYLIRFESPLSADEIGLKSAIAILHSEAEGSAELVNSPDFYSLSLENQKAALNIYEERAEEHLAELSDMAGEDTIEFRVTEYRNVPQDLLELGWGSPMVAHEKATGGVTLSIFAESFSVYSPDTDNPGRERPFESVDDFALSGGEPMIVLTNEITGMHYLVKLRDIVDCSVID